MSTTPTPLIEPAQLNVTSVLPQMTSVLSTHAQAVFANQLAESSPQLFYFGALYVAPCGHPVELADIHDFARRLNYVIAVFDGFAVYRGGYTPCVYACIAPPLAVPLAGDRVMLAAYVFIRDLPADLPPGTSKTWVNAIVGHQLRCALEGELPENPPGLFTPPEVLPVDVDEALRQLKLR